jgi:hypothetical protein
LEDFVMRAADDGSNGNMFYGWFDDPDQREPSYDPPHNAPCSFCGMPINADDVRTHSIMYEGQYAARSYFYRTHRSCAERDRTRTAMDDFIFGMIERNGD